RSRDAQALEKGRDDGARDYRSIGDGRAELLDLVERRLAAEAAAGRGGEAPLVSDQRDGAAGRHRHHVVFLLVVDLEAVRDGGDVVSTEHALGDTEADREL